MSEVIDLMGAPRVVRVPVYLLSRVRWVVVLMCCVRVGCNCEWLQICHEQGGLLDRCAADTL